MIACAQRLWAKTEARTAVGIFEFVRDLPYEGDDFEDIEIFRASHVLAAGHGYCVSNASLGAALAQAASIPARVVFADVRNHLAFPRQSQARWTGAFACHGYVEMWPGQHWVKLSPAFDQRHVSAPSLLPITSSN